MKNKNVLWLSLLFSIGIIITSSCSYDLELKPTDDVSTTNELLEGQLLRSSEYRYPHVYEIVTDDTVIKNMELAWEMMIESASENGRREFGFYIYYDDRFKKYECGIIRGGPVVTGGEGTHASLCLGGAANNRTVCAFFHCHTTLQYCTSDVSRVTGPSTSDIEFAYNQGLPGILYDYSAEYLIGGTYKGAPYKTYTFGPTQRTF